MEPNGEKYEDWDQKRQKRKEKNEMRIKNKGLDFLLEITLWKVFSGISTFFSLIFLIFLIVREFDLVTQSVLVVL